MKVSVNDKELITLTEIQKKVLQTETSSDVFEEKYKERIAWLLMHKYEQCYKRLRDKWTPVLIAEGAESIPTDPDVFAELIFAREDYKDQKALDEEAKV